MHVLMKHGICIYKIDRSYLKTRTGRLVSIVWNRIW